jgi:DNA repair exonuclease SbcCD ATPase subunit
MVYQMQDKLEQIKKEIEMLTLQEAQAEGPVYDIKLEKESLEEVKLDTHKEIDVENMHKQSYMHMRERLKKDFTAAKIQTGELEASLKSKQQILELEMLKFRKTKEAKLQSKAIIESLMKNIEKEQKDRSDRILELQRCIKNKEESVQRRIERQKRNQEIAEAAANENKDSSELKMRESLYIQKLWNAFMRKKMEREMNQS